MTIIIMILNNIKYLFDLQLKKNLALFCAILKGNGP